MGSEDFLLFTEGFWVFFFLGLGVDGIESPALHNQCFDFNDSALEYGIKMFANLSLSSLTSFNHHAKRGLVDAGSHDEYTL